MISKLILFISIFLLLAALFLALYMAKTPDSGSRKKQLIFYFIATGILIGITGCLGFIRFTEIALWVFICALVWLLILGSFHVWLFQKLFKPNVSGKVLFTLATGFFGYVLVLFFYKLYFKAHFPWVFFLPLFCFWAPVFIRIAFENFVRIPVKIFKAWDFPPPGSLSDPTDAEMDNVIILNFVIRRNTNDTYTVFKAKAPQGMKLGKLFYYFIMDYNSRHTDNPILLEDEFKTLCKWAFHTASGILGSKNHLDPELSISQNQLKENESVTCERI